MPETRDIAEPAEQRSAAPSWLPDAAPSRFALVRRCLTLPLRLWRPWRFWREVSAATPVSVGAVLVFLFLIVLTRIGMGVMGTGDEIAFAISPPPSPGWGLDAPELIRKVAYPEFASRARNDGVLDPSWLAGPLAGHTMFLLMLLGLGQDRSRVGVTGAHVFRAWTYGLVWLGAIFLFCALGGLLDAIVSARWIYSDFTQASDTLESVTAGFVRATESPILLGVIGVWILLWWHGAIVSSWKVPRGRVGWALISVVAIGVGYAAVKLTDHLQTLDIIAAG